MSFIEGCRSIDKKAGVFDNRVMRQRVAFVSAFFAIFLFLLPFSTPKAHAAWFLSDPQSFGQTLQDAESSNQVQKEGYDFSTQTNMMNTLVCLISGCGRDVQKNQENSDVQRNSGSAVSYDKSALAGINNLILTMYTNPPATTYMAMRDIGQSLGFIPKQAYAQGVGFSGLAPLIPIWKAFRNIAYVLLAIVMIVIGFMVMFRRKIDPKTVVTIQNALPRIVITLLLITFSYAIVGLFIDTMYLVLALSYALFKSTGYLPDNRTTLLGINLAGASVRDVILSGNLFQAVYIIFPSGIFSVTSIANAILGGGTTEPIYIAVVRQALLIIPNAILDVVLALAMIFIVLRLFIMFLTAYVQIILSLIFGPIQILMGAIPGTDSFGGWIKNLISNLAVFPVAGILFMLSIVFAEVGGKLNGPENTLWAPPYYTLANNNINAITALFSIGILMMIPNIAGSIKKALKAQGVPMGAGGAFGPIFAGGQMLMTHYLQQRGMERAMQKQEDARQRTAAPTGQKAES